MWRGRVAIYVCGLGLICQNVCLKYMVHCKRDGSFDGPRGEGLVGRRVHLTGVGAKSGWVTRGAMENTGGATSVPIMASSQARARRRAASAGRFGAAGTFRYSASAQPFPRRRGMGRGARTRTGPPAPGSITCANPPGRHGALRQLAHRVELVPRAQPSQLGHCGQQVHIALEAARRVHYGLRRSCVRRPVNAVSTML